jgi:zinc transporter ZupT
LNSMRPLVIIYWARLGLAVLAGAISTWITLAFGERGISTFLNGLTIALLVYLVTYYLVFKPVFKEKVEKQSKLMSQGIGIYFFAWLVSWILIYTLVLGQPPAL